MSESKVRILAELVVGRTVILYEVRRSARARRRRIVVTPGRVEVVAPAGQTDAEIAEYVRARRRWVYDAVETLRERERERDATRAGAGEGARPGRFVSGAKVLYRGRRVRVRVVTAPAEGGAAGAVGGGVLASWHPNRCVPSLLLRPKRCMRSRFTRCRSVGGNCAYCSDPAQSCPGPDR